MLLSRPDVTVLGAGVIGLTLALELHRRGAAVTILETRAAAAQASWAAAGMLAARDPHNPTTLGPLAVLSAALYPAFLEELRELSGLDIPFQTRSTCQTMPDGSVQTLRERSIDPRQLAVALLTAVQHAGITLRQKVRTLETGGTRTDVVVHATGAWAAAAEVAPRKGQMLRVQLPPGSALEEVHRSEAVYVVPRTQGPQAGTALIGATVEDAGFDTSTTVEALASLRQLAVDLVPDHPELGDSKATPLVEAWAGLRPATPDGLPLLGALPAAEPEASPKHYVAAGHFRNGILLAPATAVLMADLIEGRTSSLDLGAYAPDRFTRSAALTP